MSVKVKWRWSKGAYVRRAVGKASVDGSDIRATVSHFSRHDCYWYHVRVMVPNKSRLMAYIHDSKWFTIHDAMRVNMNDAEREAERAIRAAVFSEKNHEKSLLRPLIQAIGDGQKPPLPWVVQYSQHGVDPVTYAWRSSHDPCDLVDLAVCLGMACGSETSKFSSGKCPASRILSRVCCHEMIVNGRRKRADILPSVSLSNKIRAMAAYEPTTEMAIKAANRNRLCFEAHGIAL